MVRYDDPIPAFDIMNHEHRFERLDEAETLLPCPFCGATKDIYVESYERELGRRWRVTCATCTASIDNGYTQNKEHVIVAWNKRA